ncbi:hypothetical protein [Skermania piniformis]|uniref:Saccharopine dehydrogenase n=1 Tax=Skermania pinensis TaxID=39122 RepID=A0ABX8SC92_9ACTN|nr:hypothetical protein [Skermania piniformis]QXQ15489.1 hypothetical protein KV203_09435 [Skermania piniformis]
MAVDGRPGRYLVLGGYGNVGRRVVEELRLARQVVLVAGRDPARSDVVLDLRDPDIGSYRRTLAEVDVVVNASGSERLELAEQAGESGRPFVDISATTSYVTALTELPAQAPVLVDVGLAPGLTNLLTAAVHAEAPHQPIDILVYLGAGDQHGAAAIEWTFRLFGAHFADGTDPVRNYTRPRAFYIPGVGRRQLVRLDFSDQHTLTRDLDIPVRTYFALDSTPATALLRMLTWIPGASRAPRGVHLPGSDQWTVAARAADGTIRWAHGRNQSWAGAVVAARAARAARGLPAGTYPLHRVLALDDLPVDHGFVLGGS